MGDLGPYLCRGESLVLPPNPKLDPYLYLRLVSFLWAARPKLAPIMTNRPAKSP